MVAGIAAMLAAGALTADADAAAVIHLDWTRYPLRLCLFVGINHPLPKGELQHLLCQGTETEQAVWETGDAQVSAGTSAEQSGGFDKGRWPVCCPGDRAGFLPAPVSPRWAIARIPLSNPPRPRDLSG